MFAVRSFVLGLALLAVSLTLSGCAVVFADLNPFGRGRESLAEETIGGEGKDKILVIEISGVISAQEREQTFGLRHRDSLVARVVNELQRAARDDRVKAVVLRINSPGGGVTASDILYHEVRSFSEQRHIPVVAQFMDLGTSGAYYLALAADEIAAQPTTVTGSIGVIMFSVNLEGLLDKVGVKDQTMKAGEHKDIGSPLRTMTADERRILQGVLDDMRGRFVGLVRERRPGASEAALATATDGRVLTASEALNAGLIDRIGYLDDAIGAARRRAGLTQARVVMYRLSDEYADTVYSRSSAAPAQVNLVNLDLGTFLQSRPDFMYLWLPGAAE